MEPDHSASIEALVNEYPNILVVGNTKTFQMLKQFFPNLKYNEMVVKENDILSLGKHNPLSKISAPTSTMSVSFMYALLLALPVPTVVINSCIL